MAEDNQSSRKRVNHTWTPEEDKILVQCLKEIGLAWKGDNGFRPGFASQLEKMIRDKLPGCSVRATPHITSRIKVLKRHYRAICEMIGPTGGSGFGWNARDKMIVVEKEIYNEWVKTHPSAKGLFNKPFPYFDALGPIFGNDIATGQNAEGPADAVKDTEREVAVFADNWTGVDNFVDIMGDTTQPATHDQIPQNVTHSPASVSVARRGKKRSRSKDPLVEVVMDAIKDLSQTCQTFTENMTRLVGCVGQKDEGRTTKVHILEELRTFEWLTVKQRVKVSMIMAEKDALCKDAISALFMEMNNEERHLLVKLLLEPSP